MPLITIASVQNVYAVVSPQEFIDLVTACNYIVAGQAQSDTLPISIVKATPDSIYNIHPPVKGLIFRTDTGEIVAPGIYKPSDVNPADITHYEGSNGPPVGWSMAMDGVLIRIYRYNDKVHWSTSGMYDPTEGRWGTRTFGSLFADVLNLNQVNNDAIKDNLCYYAILEHSDLLSFYRPMDTYAMLTLIRVVDMYGNTESMETLVSHKDAFVNVLEYKKNPLEDQAFISHLNLLGQEQPPDPVTYDTFGVMIYYNNNDIVRVLSSQAKKALPLVPNMPNVWQHWIHCVWMGGFGCVNLYSKFFPWRKAEFDGYTDKLRSLYGSDLRTVTKKILRELVLNVRSTAEEKPQSSPETEHTPPVEVLVKATQAVDLKSCKIS